MAFVDVAGPLNRLHISREFDDLRLQRTVDHPSRTDRNILRATLAARQVDFNSDEACTDARDVHYIHEDDQQDDSGHQNRSNPENPRSVRFRSIGTSRMIKNCVFHNYTLPPLQMKLTTAGTTAISNRIMPSPSYNFASLG